MKAYCYRSGQIGFTSGPIPDGALPIRFRATEAEIEKIKVFARLAYDNKTLLVPGIPEADSADDAYAAFTRFVEALNFPTPEPVAKRRRIRSAA